MILAFFERHCEERSNLTMFLLLIIMRLLRCVRNDVTQVGIARNDGCLLRFAGSDGLIRLLAKQQLLRCARHCEERSNLNKFYFSS
jgi:hypothetical protein